MSNIIYNQDIVVINGLVTPCLEYGGLTIDYDIKDYMTRFGLIVPMSKSAWGIFDYLKNVNDEQIQDPEYGSQNISDSTALMFHVNWEGQLYYIHTKLNASGLAFHRVPLPKRKKFTLSTNDVAPVVNAVNLLVKESDSLDDVVKLCQRHMTSFLTLLTALPVADIVALKDTYEVPRRIPALVGVKVTVD